VQSLGLLHTPGLWRVLSGLALLWLAVVFGRTLHHAQVPLIQRVASASDPALPPELCRYTRRLTAVWCGYFTSAAALTFIAAASSTAGYALEWTGTLIWSGTIALFVGEHWLRPRLFPGRTFPGLWQQVRDTWSVWHP
jgi:uncharacterized membrane protein